MIEFNEELHQYKVNGKILPSVSQIMKRMSDDVYNTVNPYVLENARIRGTAVHKAIEMYELFGIEPTDDEILIYFNRYLKAKEKHKFVVTNSELILTNNVFCGTLDQIVKMEDVTCINDIKVTSKRNMELLEVQLAGYYQLARANNIQVDKCYVTHLTKTSGVVKEVIPNFDKWNQIKKEFIFIKELTDETN